MSSKFAISGLLAQAYDYSIFSAAKDTMVGSSTCVLEHVDYPPTLFLLTFPLGLMPYSLALAIWIVCTLVIYLGAVHAIIPRRTAVIAALAPFPVFMNVLLGHNGFLTAGLLGFALAFMESQPTLAGIFLGFLSYKPQFGILFPMVLLASRNWRAFFSATSATMAFAFVASVVFGYQVWLAFFAALGDRVSSLAHDSELNAPLISFLGVFQSGGVSPEIAWTVQLTVTALTAGLVCSLWTRSVPYPLKAAALAIGAVLAAPHAMNYDLCILSIAVAFLVRDGLIRGFMRGERAIMGLCWAGVFLMGMFPYIVCTMLLVLVIRRANLTQIRIAAPAKGHLAYG
jgi:hypothetical protein